MTVLSPACTITKAFSRHSFAEIGRLIKAYGGRITDLDEAKLTHVVVDKRDASRRLELMKRTSRCVWYFEIT
jgi:DNA ligase 4